MDALDPVIIHKQWKRYSRVVLILKHLNIFAGTPITGVGFKIHTTLISYVMNDRPTTIVPATDVVNYQFSLNGVTPLHRLYKYLSRNITKFNSVSTCIMWAIKNNYPCVGKFLLSRVHINSIHLAILEFIISAATTEGYVDILRLLLSDTRVQTEIIFTRIARSAASKCHVEIMKFILADDRVNLDGEILNMCCVDACVEGHDEIVRLLLCDKRADPGTNNNLAIRMASVRGHVEVVRLLLVDKRVNPSDDQNSAICDAARHARANIVKLLLADDRVDPSAYKNRALRMAVRYGDHNVVKLLLNDKRVDPSANRNSALRHAVRRGRYSRVVQLLLADTRVDPTDTGDEDIIDSAASSGNVKMMKMLLSDRRIKIDKLDLGTTLGVLAIAAATKRRNREIQLRRSGGEFYPIDRGLSVDDDVDDDVDGDDPGWRPTR